MSRVQATTNPLNPLSLMLAAAILAAGLGLTASPAAALVPVTEHTFKLKEGQKQPAATLEDAAWLVGYWQGEAFGGTIEEAWTPATAGSMMGVFRLMEDGETKFYEFILLVEEEGSLVMKLKHFHPDLKGWEEKDDFVSFPLVKITEEGLYFRGLTFLRMGSDEIQAFIALKHQGKVREEELTYRRLPSR